MVLAAKVFEVKADATIGSIAAKLRDFRRVERVKEGDEEFELLTDVHDITAGRNYITGVFSKDKLFVVKQRDKRVPVVKTIDALIDFRDRGDKLLLTVLQEKYFANSVAATLSNELFLSYRAIVEAIIPSENMQKLHEENPDATKLIWFDQIDIPGVDKLALAGQSLRDTSLYQEYLSHGKIWYIVFTTRDGGRVIGLTRNAVVTAFTRMEERDFLDYIFGEVFELIA